MTEPRSRSLVWLEANGHLFAQIWFDKPRVGCADMKPVAERKLDPQEYALTLDHLVQKYPAPAKEEV
jgi:hypothetical protein